MKKWIRFVVVIGMLLAFLSVLVTASYITDMDREELHYDADSYFLMIDQKHHIMGFYDGTHPMRHMWCNQKIRDGVYDVEIIHGEGLLLEHQDTRAFIRLHGSDLKWVEANYETGHPAIVYGGKL